MAGSFSVKMEGVDALSKRLEGLSYDMARKGGRSALRAAAKVIANAAIQEAQSIDDPKSREDIAKNITFRWSPKYNKQTGDLMFRVGIQGGAGGAGGNLSKKELNNSLPGGDTRHWRYIQFGSENNAANPFMTRAAETASQPAANTFVVQYNKSLDKLIKKMGA